MTDEEELAALNAQLGGDEDDKELAELNAQSRDGNTQSRDDEELAALNAGQIRSDDEELAALNAAIGVETADPEKKSLGIFGTLGAQTDFKAGRETGAVEAVAENLPVVGQVMDAEYNRQWHVIKRLYEGDFRDTTEATILAQSIGLSDDEIRRINEESSVGPKPYFGGGKTDVVKAKALYKELVSPEFAKRLQVREQAQQKLAENDLNWVQQGIVGGVGATKLIGSMANTPLAMATLGIDATNRAAEQLEGKWVLDENGQPTKIWWRTDENGDPVRDEAGNLVPREEVSQDMAVLKGITGAATERFIWMGLGKVAKQVGGALVGAAEKTAAGAKVSEALAKATSGTMKGVQEATQWLEQSAAGRGVLNIGKVIGWLNSKGKFGSIPDMMVKSRIQELADQVVGLAVADPADRESFSDWASKFFSVKENAELFTEMLAMHLAMKTGGLSLNMSGRALEKIGLKEAREFDRKSAIGRRVEETVAELVGEERAAELTDKDLVNLYRIVTSDGFTAERAEQFAEKVAGDVDAAQKLIDEGASLSSLAEGLKARRQYSDQFVEGAKAAAAELRDRVTLDGVQSGRINDAALKAAEGNVEIAAKVAALAKSRLTNKHTQVDDAKGLESLIADALRPFAPEARAVKIHDMKGNRNVGEQLTALEELGITSVEDAELNNVVQRDENGRLTGDARQAVNIAAHGTDALKASVKEGSIDAATAEALITTAHTELGTEAPEARAELVDGILGRANGDAALARRMAEIVGEVEPGDAISLDTIAERAKASLALEEPRQTRLDEISGCKLSSIEGGVLGCNRFRSMSAQFGESTDEAGNVTKKLSVKGLGEGQLAKPGNWADGAVLVAELQRVAEKNGAVLDFGSVETATEAAGLLAKIQREGLERARAKLETRAKLFDVLARSALDTGVTFDEASFRKALAETGNGRRFVDNHGNIYGFKSADGTLHFNPAQLDYNIPIHEYGHLALESLKGVNRKLWERGMELVKGSDYYKSIKEQAETEGHEYGYLKGDDAGICDEALATLIGDNGEKLVEAQGVGAELKAWLKEFWTAFKGAFGLADMTDAQIEKLTLGEFVDAVNAELLRGKEFGTRKAMPLEKKSIKRYDEAEGSGSNGMLRWKNDRGRLFYIPVDMERTQPGGKVVLATDDANITDWIKQRLNGYTLRMSKKGKIYVEGRDGFEGELAEIFGRYPKAGMNDGVGKELASVLNDGSLREATPDRLVGMLTKDRANYDEWVKATHEGNGSLQDAKIEEHYADEAARAEYEARRRWEDSGMDVPEYILSRIEEGEPGFDLEWETMRELAHDEAEGRFAVGGKDVPEERQIVKFAVAKKVTNSDGGVSYKVERNGQVKRYKTPKEALEDFIKELDGVEMNAEQQGIYDVVTGAKNTADIRKNDLGELIKFHKGGRGKGAGKIIAVHYAGKRGKVTAKEVIDIGQTIRSGVIEYDGTAEHPYSHTYTATASDGADLKVVIDLDKKGNEAVINFYSDRKTGNGGQRPHPVSTTASSSGGIIANSVDGAQGGAAKLAVGGIFTGTAADYANRSRQGGVDDGPSLKKIGTGEGSQVYGWGLYGSTVRGVAEVYMDDATHDPRGLAKNFLEIHKTKDAAIKAIKKGLKQNAAISDELKNTARKAIKILQSGKSIPDTIGNLYEQTFFTNRAPGDESHLLMWYRPVEGDQRKWIEDALQKENLVTPEAWGAPRADGAFYNYTGPTISFSSGDSLYRSLSKLLGTPQAASEFLARAGIDGVKYPVDSYGGKGVKDGDKVGWNYVSFRDDNIRVDHKWTDGQAKFAVEQGNLFDNPWQSTFDFSTKPAETPKPAEVEIKEAVRDIAGGSNRIEDVGEKIAGARKDILKNWVASINNATKEQLYSLPFAKAFKKPDIKKAVESGSIRTSDADFYTAILSSIPTKKPVLTKRDEWRKRVMPDYTSALDNWVENTHTTLTLLKEFLELDETGRDKLIAFTLGNKFADISADQGKIQSLKNYNPDTKFGEAYTPNPIYVTSEVLKRVGHEIGESVDIPFSIKPNTLFDGYDIRNQKGEYVSGFSSADLEQSIDRVAYLVNLKRGVTDLDHPDDAFRVYPGRRITGETGKYRVMWGGRFGMDHSQLFDSKEEAENFAQKHKTKPIPDVGVIGQTDYQVNFVNRVTGEVSKLGDRKFATREEANEYLDQHRDEINDQANEILAANAGKPKDGGMRADDLVRVGWSTAAHTWAVFEHYKGNDTVIRTFKTLDEAKSYRKEIKDDYLEQWKKNQQDRKKFVYFDTGDQKRIGEDYREGKDVGAEDFMNRFGFRGVQFGNWANQADRQMALNQGYDALLDLAKIIGVPPKAISLNGELGIAFGARGSGSALAHYEPDEIVINLTKTKGAGSLAHEWWHALDNYFARAAGVKAGMVTDNSRIQMRKVLRDAYTQFTSEMSRSAYGKRSKAQGTYWGSMHEITARFFAEWVTSELAREGAQNTFLSHPMDSTRWLDYNYKLYEQQQRSAKNTPMSREDFAKTPEAYMGYPFPTAEDVNTFGALVRKIFDTIEVREEGEGDNKTLALFATARRNPTTDGQAIGDWIIGADGTLARRGTPQAAMIGGARVADDAGRGEQTPGSMAAALERLNAPRTTMKTIGTVRPTSLPISEMEFLRKYLTGDHLPAKIAKKIAGGKIAAHTKAGRLTIAADVFGLVDKTDVAPAKDRLKQHGFFRNEDEAWAANHSEVEVRQERERSEAQLGDELLKIADRRARGVEAGGESAARGVYANELAKIVMEMPRKEGGVIGRVQKIGDAVRSTVKEMMTEKGAGNAKDAMADEARRFLDWARGGAEPEGAAEKTDREITDEMFASWLVMPEEMGKLAPTWSEAILRTVAETPKLAEAFKELSYRALSKDSHKAVFEAVRKSQTLAVEKALKELEADRTEKISAGSRIADAKEKIIVTFHDTMGAVAVRIDEKTRQYLAARRKVLAGMKARGATKGEIVAVENEIDMFAQKIGQLKNRLELSRTAMERGTWNEGRRYMLQYLLLENKATKKWGLSEEDKSAYLDMMRIVETQGRASSYGMDPRQARLALGDMARRLGAEKWAKLEEYGREFFSVMEREFLNDPRVERMWGKGMIDYFRTQAHYVTTKRVHSQEELDAIETARAKARAAGVNGGDDVIGAMFTYAGPRGGASALGLNESAWKAKLTGSMGAKQEVRSATWEKQQMLMQSARRNQFVLDLRDALLAAKVEGVRDVERGDRDVKPGSRYGAINYVENGVRRTLIVPAQIAEGMKVTPDNMPWLTKFHNAARGLMIDWNVAYWNRNIMRNSGSIEKNMPSMHESWLKTVLRVAPGMAPTVDLACQHLARHSKGAAKAMTALFGRDTIFPYIQQAGRMAKLLEDPTAWQERLWDAEARGDAAEVAEMHEDLRQTMEMLKGNMFLPNKAAYGNRETQGFANDMMNKAGFRMVAQMQQQAARTRLGRAVDLVKSPFKRNERQQEYEDVLAKSIAYLHDRAVYGAERSVEESGLTVKRNVSIAEGERKGTESRIIQRYMTQFFNMTEKGVTRTVRALQERPGETLGKMARTWVGRFVGGAMTYGLVTRAIRALYGDDEEKAKASPLGEVYGFAKWIENANRNLSNYVRNHYQTIPLWVSDDGYTTIVLGTPLNDEDSLLAPSADFAAKAFANAMGSKNDLALGQMLADTFIRPVTPDLAIATPALKVIRDTIEATMVQNPTDLFTGAPTYDRDLYALRNENWGTRKDFALAMARQVYNDVGARGFMAVDRQGVNNGTGAAPKWIGLALKKIPVLSPVLNSFVKVQVGSPERDAKSVRDVEQRLQHVRNYLSRKLMTESADMGGALNRTDPQRYAELLEGWQQEYGLSDHDMRLVEKRFLNGWTEYENEEARRHKVIQGTLRKARKLGVEDAERYMIRGEL